jgi:hypothetical protein
VQHYLLSRGIKYFRRQPFLLEYLKFNSNLIYRMSHFWGPFPYDAMDTPANENALFCLLKNEPLFVPHDWPITALAWWKYPYYVFHSVVRKRAAKNGTSCTLDTWSWKQIKKSYENVCIIFHLNFSLRNIGFNEICFSVQIITVNFV